MLAYLACPYSHPDPEVRRERFESVNRMAARLMSSGEHIFSPISHTHPIALAGNLPLDWDFWEAYDRAILRCCARVYVLQLDGWAESSGVRGELAIAEEFGLEVVLLTPECYHETTKPDARDARPV